MCARYKICKIKEFERMLDYGERQKKILNTLLVRGCI
jgi:hypothetical protein